MATSEIIEVRVPLGDRSYGVLVGKGARARTAELLPSKAARVAVVTQRGVPSNLVPDLPGFDVSVHVIGDGEDHKSLATIADLCSAFARAGLTRNDVVVAVGGGMVTDVAGFAAASYHRGIAVVHVATSLLAMIDAAVGGKTGVNIPEGKNLVGAFWQPNGVVCDLDALESLPEREMRCGLGEMAKYHFIAREDLHLLDFPARVARCIGIKGDIVAADEREGGIRAFLNYGHTLAHALEIETGFAIAHGEAVALGVLFAGHLSHVTGRIGQERLEEHYSVVRGLYGLDIGLPEGMEIDALIEAMGRDKKSLGSLTFVLDGADGLSVVDNVSPGDIRAAWAAFSARA